MLKSKNKLLHKALAIVLTFSLLATLISFNFTASAEINRAGSASNPYIITTAEDLKAFANSVNAGETTYTNAYVKLADNSNITITDSWTPIGNANHKFTGVFDGNNNTITFNGSITDGDYVGLFGINEGTIKNVTVAGSISSSAAKAFVGGVAALNRGTIINCENGATIKTTGVNSYAGGIAGVMQYGTIESCKNSGAITVSVSGNTSDDVTDHEASAGGIVAFNYNGTVKKSTNAGSITNNDSHGYTGGIVGNNDGVIDNCLNSENTTITNTNAPSYVGGIAGNLFTNNATGSTATISNCLNINDSGEVVGTNSAEPNNGTVTNSYYKSENNNDDGIDGTTAVTDAQLKSGDVAYNLNNKNVDNPVWRHDLSDENNLPFIGTTSDSSNDNVVYPDNSSDSYTNTKPDSNSCAHEIQNGSCIICGKVIGKVVGNTIKLDGKIGLNFYFDIAKDATSQTITFTKDGKNIEGILTQDNKTIDTQPVSDGCQRYVATIAVDSDQMNLPVTANLSITYNTEPAITITSKEYTVNGYLNKLYTSSTSNTLKDLVMAMSTYGYYSNRYFNDYAPYETVIPEYKLTANGNTISNPNYNLTYDKENTGNLSHSASSLQHLEEIRGVFYVNGVTDTDNTYMEYKYVNLDNTPVDNSQQHITKVEKSGSTVYAITEQIPIAELSSTKFAVTFGTYQDDNYTANTNVKYYAPYTYIRNILKKYSSLDTTNPSYKLAQALYHYSEAAYAYFKTSSSQS